MPSQQVTLVAATIATVQLDAPTGRVIITQEAGTAAEVYITSDGTNPGIPTSGVTVPGSQQTLSAALGSVAACQPPQFGDHMAVGQIRLLSAGTPTVLVQW
jgi:hypothetical protein